MNIPVLGMVENMSYITCPDCGKKMPVFGESHIEATAAAHNITKTATLPIDPRIAKTVDAGNIESIDNELIDELAKLIEE